MLFLYGTLMHGSDNPVAAALHAILAPGLAAQACGLLFAIPDPAGWYPAFLPDPVGGAVHGMVHGTVHCGLPAFGAAALPTLDAYEDCRPGGTGEYRREPVTIRAGRQVVAAHTYVYNAALPVGAVPIPSGDFRAFLAATGLPAFR